MKTNGKSKAALSDQQPESEGKPQDPTTFELAQLAALLLTREQATDDKYRKMLVQREAKDALREHEQCTVFGAVERAMYLWTAADRHRCLQREWEQQLRALVENIFTLSEADWSNAVFEYRGPKDVLHDRMKYPLFRLEDVEKELFRDTSMSSMTRRKLLIGLIDLGVRLKVPFTDYRRGSEFEVPVKQIQLRIDKGARLPGNICRWLVSVRQRQKSENKSGIVPQRQRYQEHDSSQYKKPRKA